MKFGDKEFMNAVMSAFDYAWDNQRHCNEPEDDSPKVKAWEKAYEVFCDEWSRVITEKASEKHSETQRPTQVKETEGRQHKLFMREFPMQYSSHPNQFLEEEISFENPSFLVDLIFVLAYTLDNLDLEDFDKRRLQHWLRELQYTQSNKALLKEDITFEDRYELHQRASESYRDQDQAWLFKVGLKGETNGKG